MEVYKPHKSPSYNMTLAVHCNRLAPPSRKELSGNCGLLYSNFIEIDQLYYMTSGEVVHKLKVHMAQHEIPKCVVSGNGPQYNCDEFCLFAVKYEF